MARFNIIDYVQNTVTESFIEGLVDGLIGFLAIWLLLIYSPALTVVVVSSTGLYALFRLLTAERIATKMKEEIAHIAKRNTVFLETIRGIQAIKIFSNQEGRKKFLAASLRGTLTRKLTCKDVHGNLSGKPRPNDF